MEKKKNGADDMKRQVSEETLFKLFDYQRFESDPLLKALISETESEYGAEISDDDLSFVNAAGEANPTDRVRVKYKDKDKRDGEI